MFKIDEFVKEKAEYLKQLFEKVKGMGKVNMVLLVLAVVFFFMFYSSIKDNVFEVLDWFLNLRWYWYLAGAIIFGIKPVMYFVKRK